MRRGVFALTWFFLVSSTLISLYAAKESLLGVELQKQSSLMTAEELFYTARNFEFDFFKSVSQNTLNDFYLRWKPKGDLNYGRFDYEKKVCEQDDSNFLNFVKNKEIKKGTLILFENSFCITLELQEGGFKTAGIIVSPICINTSSPYFSC